MEPTFEQIKPLIVEETWTGNQVTLKLKAANQEAPMETMGFAMPSQEEIMKRVAAETAKSMASGVAISSASNALGNLTGVSGAGSAINSAANAAGVGYQMDPSKLMHVELTDEVKQRTIINAFMSLSMYYAFENGAWIYKNPYA